MRRTTLKFDYVKDRFSYSDMKLDQTTILRSCYGCDESIQPNSWYYLVKDSLKPDILVHKFCNELPEEVTHPLHKQHLLRLNPFMNLEDRRSCGFCHRSLYGSERYMYSCKPCDFHVDLMCGVDATLKILSLKSPEERKRMALKDLSHNHQLKLLRRIIQSRQDDDDDDDSYDDNAIIQHCKACLQPILDSTYYICTEESDGCKDYYLHKFCAELPLEIKHELHKLHPLKLIVSPPPEHFKCFACRNFCEGHIYSCRICSFELDIICATTKSRVLEYKCHRHPLTLLPMSNSSLFCSACCKVHEGMFYQCTSCVVFFIHQDCASLDYVIYHPSHQGHPLRLGFPLDGTKKRHDCDMCYNPIYGETGWFYYCFECKFYAHLNCITSDNDRDVQQIIDKKVPCLPWEEADNEFGIVGLLNKTLTSTSFQNGDDRGSEEELETINHFSHPEHALILQSDAPMETHAYSNCEIILTTQCNGCSKQISAPLYSCVGCNFYLHKGCALLPTSITRHLPLAEHAHCELGLVKEPFYESRAFPCVICTEECNNGFSYKCKQESCRCIIDVECAFLPNTIVHKAHPFHTLHLEQEQNIYNLFRFKCCVEARNWHPYVYRCDTDSCNFRIHSRCAMYPAKAHHRFDCDNPFLLCYNPSMIEPNEYHYCDFCEKILDPKKWFYFSSKMFGQIMHPQCLLLGDRAIVGNRNFKSISSFLEGAIHHHPLHLYPSYDFMDCHHCKTKMKDHNDSTTDDQQMFHFTYQCVAPDCKYQIHASCVNKFFLQAKQDFQDKGMSTKDCNIEQLFLEGIGRSGVRRKYG